MAVSGACAAFSCLSIFVLMARHAMHFSRPNEQTKILKICALIPIYAVLSFITIAVPDSYVYLTPWIEVFQAIALGSFFLLLCEYVSPSAQTRDVFFAALKVSEKKGKQVQGLGWYRRRWFLIFQYPLVTFAVAIITDATQPSNEYCLESSNIHFAHLWCSIASRVSVTFAVISVLRFFGVLKKDLKHHKPVAKFLAFKLIIALTFVQSIIFQILRSKDVLTGTSKLTYADVNFGIQTMIICCEMVPFAVFFHYAYDVRPYDISKPQPLPLAEMTESPNLQNLQTGYGGAGQYQYPQQQQPQHQPQSAVEGTRFYQGGPLGIKAWLSVLNPMEILEAKYFAFVMKSESKRRSAEGSPAPPYTYRQ
ncbi:hypothetical protein A1O1_06412 [Capronia coronata CBS 617.96]|uniref:Transmembrane protein 184C n=1 Tax=Capronia coronata CBS 617.96 TaxID=1182541 RepID=W9Y0N3_9EURO|nr:uncharacterized protein A1O1_06412 [Capronia coronata CBS 617.96]EXJ86043.1 hypothetical protein A1O1_06412 [Capronia coronata CBS 617.96]